MRVIKPMQQGLMSRTLVRNRRFYLSVASLSYFPFHNPIALGTDQEMWSTITASSFGDMVFDAAMPKVRGEVLVMGRCFAPNKTPAKRLFVDLDIGPILKRLVVTGERHWRRGERADGLFSRLAADDWERSEPVPFLEMDIGWRNAFGGAGFPENPLGKGFLPEGASPALDHSSPLPNVERPERMMALPSSVAEPAGFGPIDMTWPQRAVKAGRRYDAEWEQERYPEPAVDMDPAYDNAAPADQQLEEGFWSGDEAFAVTHMHPQKERVESRLPEIRPRIFILQQGDGRERWNEVRLHPETVWLFPNVERGVLISRGLFELDTFYGVDVDVLLMAWELKGGRTRSPEDYRRSVALRLSEETADEWAIREDDISPPEGIPEEPPIFAEDEDTYKIDFGPMIEKERSQATGILQQARAAAAKLGLDPTQYCSGLIVPIVPIPDYPSLDKLSDIPKLLEHAAKEEAALDAAAEEMADKGVFYAASKEAVEKKIEKKTREVCDAAGQDYDEIMARVRNTPPSTLDSTDQISAVLFSAKKKAAGRPELLKKLEEMISKTEGMKPDISAMADDPQIKQMQKEIAHFEEPPERPPDAVLLEKREWVARRFESGEGCEGADLSWVDLSDMALPCIRLKGATLDSAVLTNTDLSGADLSDTVLTRASLERAHLTGAVLDNANLGKARLLNADLTEAKLKNVILDQTDFTESKLIRSTIKSELCTSCDFRGADLSEAMLVDLDCLDTRFDGAAFVSADLTKSSFSSCEMTGADFSSAILEETSFVSVNAPRAVFRNAEMKDTNAHEDADFSNADFSGISSDGLSLSHTRLIGADFSFALLNEADFGESSLVGAKFHQAIARETDFTDADLTRADLSGADLMGASLQGAVLTEANFTNAHLFGADLLYAQHETACFSGAVVARTLLEGE